MVPGLRSLGKEGPIARSNPPNLKLRPFHRPNQPRSGPATSHPLYLRAFASSREPSLILIFLLISRRCSQSSFSSPWRSPPPSARHHCTSARQSRRAATASGSGAGASGLSEPSGCLRACKTGRGRACEKGRDGRGQGQEDAQKLTWRATATSDTSRTSGPRPQVHMVLQRCRYMWMV